jgi:hypothetical protein
MAQLTGNRNRMATTEKSGTSPEYAEDRDDARFPAAGETTEEMGIGKYLATRFTTLKPPMDKVENPFTLLASLNTKQWLFFFCAFIAWTWDAFDFFTVSLTVRNECRCESDCNANDCRCLTWPKRSTSQRRTSHGASHLCLCSEVLEQSSLVSLPIDMVESGPSWSTTFFSSFLSWALVSAEPTRSSWQSAPFSELPWYEASR